MGSSPVVDELITKLKTSIFSIDTQNVTKTLLDSEQRLKNQNLDLINKTHVLEMENKKLNDLLKKKDKRIESLKRKNEELEDEMKEMVEENEGLKNKVEEMKKVNDECLKKVRRVYEKRVLDFDVRVLDLEKLGKELMDSPNFSEKQKDGVVGCAAETNIQQMSNEKRESKQGTDDKFPDTIPIDDDDEDGDNDEADLKCVPSSKRQRGSSEIKREYDSDDDRYISILRRQPVTKEIPSECNNDHAKKIPTGTTTTTMPEIQTGIQQIISHSASPFLDSGSDDEKVKEANETILDKQKERSADMQIESESSKKRMSSEKGESQERTNHRFSDIIHIDDDDEDEDENGLKDVSSLKRKRSSSNVKVEDDSDGERCLSILRRKSVSKELQSECNNDHVNIIPTGRQPITSHSATPFLDSGKSDDVKVEEAYEPIIEKHTERWETEAEMIIEFSKSSELCMNAVCALHRQNIYVGAYLLPRFNQLAEWLIDGDPERKLKKTPSELNRFELDQCRMFAVNYSVELFKVYQQNADRFFPPRS